MARISATDSETASWPAKYAAARGCAARTSAAYAGRSVARRRKPSEMDPGRMGLKDADGLERRFPGRRNRLSVPARFLPPPAGHADALDTPIDPQRVEGFAERVHAGVGEHRVKRDRFIRTVPFHDVQKSRDESTIAHGTTSKRRAEIR